MEYRVTDDGNPGDPVGDWIREHGVQTAEDRIRAILREGMDPEDFAQLVITATASDSPETVPVAIEGPANLVRKAKAVVRGAWRSS
jgi:hypothetical protein